MNPHVAIRMGRSAQAFKTVVWPALQPYLADAEAIPVESVTDHGFARELDALAGIDAWIIPSGKYVRGLASRIQWPRTQKNYRTFTVRLSKLNGARTEYDKRKTEMATTGAITPHYWAHAYLGRQDRLLGAAVALTRDIIDCITDRVGCERHNPSDGTSFWCVDWDELRARRRSLIEVGPDGIKVEPIMPEAA